MISRDQIKQYLPQREPMIMVDQLISHDSSITRSGLDILEDNILVSNRRLSEAGLLENMAQTAALSKGYELFLLGEKAPIGFIGAVKNLMIQKLPMVNEHIETEIKVKHEVLNASIVEAQVFCNDEVIASCELKIFLNPQIEES